MNAQTTNKPYVIGLDLGGTNSVFGIVDARGEIKATTAIKTQGFDKVEDYVDACVEALQGYHRRGWRHRPHQGYGYRSPQWELLQGNH